MVTADDDKSWVEHLPPQERAQMEADIAGCNNPEELQQTLHEWKATALVWADPELVRALTTPIDTSDLIEVPRPDSAHGEFEASP